jgi:sporulation protein YlmC with PRC-barrel domain
MLKKFATATALTGLMLASAVAQSPPTSPNGMSPPATSSDSKSTTAPSGSAHMLPAQKPDQLLASKFKGTDVMGADNQKIGDVSDIVFARDGSKIDAYVVSVGGFLGIGSKEVALAPSEFQVMAGESGGAPKLKVSMTKDQLKQAPNFQPYKEPASTASSNSTAPRSGGTAR